MYILAVKTKQTDSRSNGHYISKMRVSKLNKRYAAVCGLVMLAITLFQRNLHNCPSNTILPETVLHINSINRSDNQLFIVRNLSQTTNADVGPIADDANVVLKLVEKDNSQYGQGLKHQEPVDCYCFSGNKTKCFLAAVINVRIYHNDKAGWTKNHLEQWIKYMLFAGASHVYLYDNYKFPNESLQDWIKTTFTQSIVTYHDWSKYHPFSLGGTQVRAYNHALHTYGNRTVWQIAFDMDEYVFAPNDTQRGFLTRRMKQLIEKHKEQNMTELSIKNILFLGKPHKATLHIESILRRTPEPANQLDKPIYRTDSLRACSMHHNKMARGNSIDIDPRDLRNNHYWGARLQNWGEDTPDIIARTIPDDSALELAENFKLYLQNVAFT